MGIRKPTRIQAVLGTIILVIGAYIGLQVYQVKQMANQYTPEKSAQTPGSTGTTSGTSPSTSRGASSNPALPSQAAPSPAVSSTNPSSANSSSNPSSQIPAPSGSAVNSSTSSPSGTLASGDYKQMMTTTYQQSLQAMQNVKDNTLALQGGNVSILAYRSNVLQSQATFTASEAFVRANPPKDETLNPSYQEFMAGISLAKESMGLVLDGISSLSPAKLYTARDLGKTAQQQVIEGYSNFK